MVHRDTKVSSVADECPYLAQEQSLLRICTVLGGH